MDINPLLATEKRNLGGRCTYTCSETLRFFLPTLRTEVSSYPSITVSSLIEETAGSNSQDKWCVHISFRIAHTTCKDKVSSFHTIEYDSLRIEDFLLLNRQRQKNAFENPMKNGSCTRWDCPGLYDYPHTYLTSLSLWPAESQGTRSIT